MGSSFYQKNSYQKAAEIAESLQDFMKTLESNVMLVITPENKRVLERARKILRRASEGFSQHQFKK